MAKTKIKDAIFLICFTVVLISFVYYYMNYKIEEIYSSNYKFLYESEITSNTDINLKILESLKEEKIVQAVNILEISLKNKIDLINKLNISSDSLEKRITNIGKYCDKPCLVKVK